MKEEQPGEADNDASDKNTNSGTAQPASKAHGEASHCKTQQAGASGSTRGRGPSGAGALQAVQAGLGSHRGAHPQCAGHAVCLPVLPEVAPRSRTRARFQEGAPAAVEPLAASGGVAKQWHAH
ncbi:MAG: hypothetical protein DMG39_11185 [Acidobacteria bacterium]|nr:MAG: hypothetical protein DMG39_11185 [Acidobacteriota bacterium]